MVVDPKDAKKQEDEYFLKKETELINKMRKEQTSKAEQDRLLELQKLHFMHCPKCGQDLKQKYFEEVEVDVCSGCEGVWLDKGELELLKKKEGFHIGHLFNIFK